MARRMHASPNELASHRTICCKGYVHPEPSFGNVCRCAESLGMSRGTWHTALVSIPIIRSATLLDAGWYRTMVCSLMLSCLLMLRISPINARVVRHDLPVPLPRFVLCRCPEHFKCFDSL